MQVLEVVFNSTGFHKVERRELADIVRECPYDAKEILEAISDGRKYTVRDSDGWGFSVTRA